MRKAVGEEGARWGPRKIQRVGAKLEHEERKCGLNGKRKGEGESRSLSSRFLGRRQGNG